MPSTLNSRDGAEEIRRVRRERDELSADLGKIRDAVRVRPSKKAMKLLKELLETFEAMDEEEAPALRILVEMADKLEAI